MPITVTAPRGVLSAEGERQVLPRLTKVLAETAGVAGDQSVIDTIGGTVHILDPADIYAGGGNQPVVFIELKLPPIVLATKETRTRFIEASTQVVAELTATDHDDRHTWVNVLHAPEGAWGIGGENVR